MSWIFPGKLLSCECHRTYWWNVNIGSGDGLAWSGGKPLPEPKLTQIFVAIWSHLATSCLMLDIFGAFKYNNCIVDVRLNTTKHSNDEWFIDVILTFIWLFGWRGLYRFCYMEQLPSDYMWVLVNGVFLIETDIISYLTGTVKTLSSLPLPPAASVQFH